MTMSDAVKLRALDAVDAALASDEAAVRWHVRAEGVPVQLAHMAAALASKYAGATGWDSPQALLADMRKMVNRGQGASLLRWRTVSTPGARVTRLAPRPGWPVRLGRRHCDGLTRPGG